MPGPHLRAAQGPRKRAGDAGLKQQGIRYRWSMGHVESVLRGISAILGSLGSLSSKNSSFSSMRLLSAGFSFSEFDEDPPTKKSFWMSLRSSSLGAPAAQGSSSTHSTRSDRS